LKEQNSAEKIAELEKQNEILKIQVDELTRGMIENEQLIRLASDKSSQEIAKMKEEVY
jgi:hypothetical protein